jgi:tetratricopeptide (TPR) repeat protein
MSTRSRAGADIAQIQAQQLFQDLSDTSLRDFAGDKVFARGQSYAASGAVQALEDLPPTPDHLMGARAMVHGTELYNTEVWWLPDDDLMGDCDCPHGQDGFFCKHQVALAMVWRAQLGGGAVATDPDAAKKVQAAAKRAQTRANNIETLRQFVFAQKAEDLAALLWRMADWDKDLMAQLKAWQAQSLATAQSGGGDTKAAQEAIRELLKNPQGYLAPRDCGPYLRRAEQIFPIIEAVFRQSPVQARALCEDALKRLYKVGETADDSWGGEFSDLIPSTTEWLKRCLQADPPPASWLKTWLALADKDPWGLVPVHEVVAAAGMAVQKAYSAHVAKDWREWHAAHPQPKGDWDSERQCRRRAYLEDLNRQGDEATALEVMRGSASTASEWAQLVQWCEDRKRWREAFDFAQKAFKLHPQDWRIEAALLTAYERDGYDTEALAMWRKRLEKNPSSDNCKATLQAAQRAGHDQAAYRQVLFDWAASQESRTERGWGSVKSRAVVDVSVRVRWYLELEKDPQAALDLVMQPGVLCDTPLLLTLAKSLPKAQDAQARVLLLRLFESAMPGASTPYTEVLNLVRLALERMNAADRALWLLSLRSQYKAKRNFIKELPIS